MREFLYCSLPQSTADQFTTTVDAVQMTDLIMERLNVDQTGDEWIEVNSEYCVARISGLQTGERARLLQAASIDCGQGVGVLCFSDALPQEMRHQDEETTGC